MHACLIDIVHNTLARLDMRSDRCVTSRVLAEPSDLSCTLTLSVCDAEQIARDLDALKSDARVQQRVASDRTCEKRYAGFNNVANPTHERSLHNSGLLQAIERECAAFEHAIASKDAAWFNDDVRYKREVTHACDLKRLAMNMVYAWLDNPRRRANRVARMTLMEADRYQRERMGHKLLEAKAAVRNAAPLPSVATWWPPGAPARSKLLANVRSQAVSLCRANDLFVEDANELVDTVAHETRLMRQAALGATPTVVLLVDAGAQPNAKDSTGRAALTYAAETGRRDTCLALVSYCK